jgi:hypothetical protein
VTRALSLAAAQRNTEARANRDFVASLLDRESLANAQRRAAEFVPKKQGKALSTFYGVAGGRRRQTFPKIWLDTRLRNDTVRVR